MSIGIVNICSSVHNHSQNL